MPDVIVLDVAMPGVDGLAVTRRLRAKGHVVPILLLTARDALAERVAGLDAGADDYLVKPFAVEELTARVRALLRRNQPPGDQLAFADLALEPASGAARRAGRDLNLTRREAELLELLMRNARGVVTRELALERIWGGEGEASANVVDRYVAYLRRKLGAPAAHPHRAGRRLPARRVRRFSLRARLTAAAVAAIVVAVALLGVAVLARLDHQLNDALDRSLRARAVEVARLAASTPAVLDEPGSLEGRLGGSSLFVQVVDPRGRLVARSSGLGGRVLPDRGAARAARVDRRAGYGDDALGDRPDARLRRPAGRARAAGRPRAARSSWPARRPRSTTTLDATRRFVVLGALVAAVLAAVLATLLARRALRPLRRLSAGARTIERSGDASARLPIPAARDEVGELAGTLNGDARRRWSGRARPSSASSATRRTSCARR